MLNTWILAFGLDLWGFTLRLAKGFNLYILMYFFNSRHSSSEFGALKR